MCWEMEPLLDDIIFEISQHVDDQTLMHLSSLNKNILKRLNFARTEVRSRVYKICDDWTKLLKSVFRARENELYSAGNWAVIQAIYQRDDRFYYPYARLTKTAIDKKDYRFAKEIIQENLLHSPDYWISFIYEQIGSEILAWGAPLIKEYYCHTSYTFSAMIRSNDRAALEKYLTYLRPTSYTINSLIGAGMADLAKRFLEHHRLKVEFPMAVIETGTFEDFLWFYTATTVEESIVDKAVQNLRIDILDFIVTNENIFEICHYIAHHRDVDGINEVFVWFCQKGLQL